MIGFYNYTVWLTFIGMLSSVTGIGLAVQGRIVPAVICLMFSGFCDMFDGIVARTKKDRTDEEKRFGIQLDSLSDIVCFGVLPFVIGVCQQQTSEKRRHYLGLPITSSALTVPLLFCFRSLLGEAFPLAYTLLLLVNGALFVVPVQVKKPNKTGLAAMLAVGVVCTALILILK